MRDEIVKILFLLPRRQYSGNHTTVDSYLGHEETLSAMKVSYNRKLASLPFDVCLQVDLHRCSCEKSLSRIIDGVSAYIWCVQERELDIPVAVEVQGGLAQSIYTNTDICAEGCSLDLT